MPEVASAASDKTARAFVGMRPHAATTAAHTAAADVHPAAGMHPAAAAGMHPAASTMTATATATATAAVTAAATMRSECRSWDEQASGYCRD
jgi:hypothetical protein